MNSETVTEQGGDTPLKVNTFARRTRHLKIFSKGNLFRIHLFDLFKWCCKPLVALTKTPLYKKVSEVLLAIKEGVLEIMPISPQRRLLTQITAVAIIIMLMTALTPVNIHGSTYMAYSSDYIDAYALPGDILVSDDDGYLVKINPQTNQSNRIGMTDYAVHTVETGESLSVIAERYSVHVETIMWENNLYNANSLRIGQKLLVPPVDGLSYKAASGDSLEKIAAKYDVTVDAIVAQNALESDVISKGQKLFLPGAEPIMPVSIAGANTSASTSSRTTGNYASSNAAPAVGKIFIYPTRGIITQGYHAGHYAIDIADRSKPPVWAAAGGTVTKASTGTWGGGYGNHVVIDHGNGMSTLYAHMDSVNVAVGQSLAQGDVIGVMGNTGRVYGATGIHLHWECIQNGVKQFCGNYY